MKIFVRKNDQIRFVPESVETVKKNIPVILERGGIYHLKTKQTENGNFSFLESCEITKEKINANYSEYDDLEIPEAEFTDDGFYTKEEPAIGYRNVLIAICVYISNRIFPESTVVIENEFGNEEICASDEYLGWLNEILGEKFYSNLTDEVVPGICTEKFIFTAEPDGRNYKTKEEAESSRNYFKNRLSAMNVSEDAFQKAMMQAEFLKNEPLNLLSTDLSFSELPVTTRNTLEMLQSNFVRCLKIKKKYTCSELITRTVEILDSVGIMDYRMGSFLSDSLKEENSKSNVYQSVWFLLLVMLSSDDFKSEITCINNGEMNKEDSQSVRTVRIYFSLLNNYKLRREVFKF